MLCKLKDKARQWGQHSAGPTLALDELSGEGSSLSAVAKHCSLPAGSAVFQPTCLQFRSYFGCFLHITTLCSQRLPLSNVEVRVEVAKSQLAVWCVRACKVVLQKHHCMANLSPLERAGTSHAGSRLSELLYQWAAMVNPDFCVSFGEHEELTASSSGSTNHQNVLLGQNSRQLQC